MARAHGRSQPQRIRQRGIVRIVGQGPRTTDRYSLTHLIEQEELLLTIGRYLEWLVPSQSAASSTGRWKTPGMLETSRFSPSVTKTGTMKSLGESVTRCNRRRVVSLRRRRRGRRVGGKVGALHKERGPRSAALRETGSLNPNKVRVAKRLALGRNAHTASKPQESH